MNLVQLLDASRDKRRNHIPPLGNLLLAFISAFSLSLSNLTPASLIIRHHPHFIQSPPLFPLLPERLQEARQGGNPLPLLPPGLLHPAQTSARPQLSCISA